ncbi:MAG: hypothetical protein ACI9XC_001234 [Gammaproteobacteria bacterium]|jgi:uncharacterized protein (TIGR02444 family)
MLFWNYSIKAYSQDGVPNACLILQDKFELDVNMILFCCWYGITNGNLSKELFCHCHEYCRTWSTKTVKPLRNIRTWLKDHGCTENNHDKNACMSYRDKIKAIELESEKIQQLTLESMSKIKNTKNMSPQEKSGTAANNLRMYLQQENIDITDVIINELHCIVQAGLQDVDTLAFKRILTG